MMETGMYFNKIFFDSFSYVCVSLLLKLFLLTVVLLYIALPQ